MKNKITITDLVNREVFYNVSHLVAELSRAEISTTPNGYDLGEQVAALYCGPIDFEEAALQVGWRDRTDLSEFPPCSQFRDKNDGARWACDGWKELCDDQGIDADEFARNVFEHWIVSDWLAEKLESKGETIDRDFVGLVIWGRTTTGQGIAMDSVIEQIHAELIK